MPEEENTSTHLADLRNRIAWLESIIKSRCPDVDLTQEVPALAASESDAEDSEMMPGQDLTDRVGLPHALADANGVEEHISSTQASGLAAEVPSSRETTTRPAETRRDIAIDSNTSTHQIGLIALGSGQDARYIGPSSGYFLARVLLRSQEKAPNIEPLHHSKSNAKLPLPRDLIDSVQGPLPMPSREVATFLCESYFNVMHVQFPILHKPTFMSMLEQMYAAKEPDPVASFQVFMVLAIGASVCSRISRPGILSDSYGIAAMRFFDQINVQNSLQGLQCLLLMSLYAMHSPSAKLSVWYLNYHCIAALLDLGLQRKIDTSSGVPLFEQEMRTRLFWSVYTLDRTIATTMGRPIGLRDEACELRLPQDISDDALITLDTSALFSNGSHMRISIHFFKLARINSEINATKAVQLHDQLYKRDLLPASWTVLHSITMSAITMMYCIRLVPSIADETSLDVWMADVSTCTNLLSAFGEHWSGAKRCRVIIDELGKATTRLVKSRQSTTSPSTSQGLADNLPLLDFDGVEADFSTIFGNSDFLLDEFGDMSSFFDLTWIGDPNTLNSTTALAP
ncbi:hypothetical protein LQW54_004872 [Pestalotiopsis sp. IQ-011]